MMLSLSDDASTNNISVIVLAGGLGTRLKSVVVNKPKVLAPISGKPFIELLLQWLESQKISTVCFSLGVMAEQVIDYINEAKPRFKINISYVVEKEPLGTLGAVAYCLNQQPMENCLVMNGDTFIELDLNEFITEQLNNQSFQALVCKKVPDVSRFGSLSFTDEHYVATFNEKSSEYNGEGWINAGIYYFSSRAIEQLKTFTSGSLEHDYLSKGCEHLRYFKVVDGEFIDIGTPESYQSAPNVLRDFL